MKVDSLLLFGGKKRIEINIKEGGEKKVAGNKKAKTKKQNRMKKNVHKKWSRLSVTQCHKTTRNSRGIRLGERRKFSIGTKTARSKR